MLFDDSNLLSRNEDYDDDIGIFQEPIDDIDLNKDSEEINTRRITTYWTNHWTKRAKLPHGEKRS